MDKQSRGARAEVRRACAIALPMLDIAAFLRLFRAAGCVSLLYLAKWKSVHYEGLRARRLMAVTLVGARLLHAPETWQAKQDLE
jgi:hypothetical protein